MYVYSIIGAIQVGMCVCVCVYGVYEVIKLGMCAYVCVCVFYKCMCMRVYIVEL